ncbi:MAG: cation diffusion facilitator family transporter [Anaerolineae bacterium]|nr:cation diffusion facilitator family transporter [Anaerolineae bacterium]
MTAFLSPLKGAMFYLVRRIAHLVGSPALLASAKDNLSDVLSSGMALGVLGSRFVRTFSAPLAAFCVAAWIFWSAAQVLWESVRQLIGGAPPEEVSEAIVEAVCSVPGVLDVHQVIVEYVGPQVRADIHIDLDGRLSLEEVHRISDQVRERVERLPEVDRAFVHAEPVDWRLYRERESIVQSAGQPCAVRQKGK